MARWVFRADAGAQLGLGHVMRSLTMAAWATSQGIDALLVSHAPAPWVAQRAAELGVALLTSDQRPGSRSDGLGIAGLGAEAVFVDGYHLGPAFSAGLDPRPPVLVQIDDNGDVGLAGPDVVVNQNPHASPALYPDVPEGRLLLGLPFALVRPEIRAARTEGADSEGRVFVSFGGSDPRRLTGPVVAALADRGIQVDVVRGSIAEHDGDGLAVPLVRQVDQVDFASRLAGAAVAVVGAGTTLWECAHLGVATVAVVVADNQAASAASPTVRSFARVVDARAVPDVDAIAEGVAQLLADDRRRLALAVSGSELVDGRGAERVFGYVRRLADAHRPTEGS